MNLYRVLYLNGVVGDTIPVALDIEPIQSVVFKYDYPSVKNILDVIEPIQSVVFKLSQFG